MNFQDQLHLSDDNYGLLFDVRRSIRYHDRRGAFYERFHQVTSVLTILMAGSVLFDIGKSGPTDLWLTYLALAAALLAAFDMVVGYSRKATLHSELKSRFADLEIRMLTGPSQGEIWAEYATERLRIEKDEPSPYYIVDALCRNELLVASGVRRKERPELFAKVNWYQWATRHFAHWSDYQAV